MFGQLARALRFPFKAHQAQCFPFRAQWTWLRMAQAVATLAQEIGQAVGTAIEALLEDGSNTR